VAGFYSARGSIMPPPPWPTFAPPLSLLLRGNQDETLATIWMRFLGRGRDQVIMLIAADKFFVVF